MDIRLTVGGLKGRVLPHMRHIRLAALAALGVLAAIWSLPLFLGSQWIVRQLEGQFPAARLEQVTWRTLPVPSVAVRRIAFADRDLSIAGAMRLRLGLAPLLAGRAEPRSLTFSSVTVSQKSFSSPPLSGTLVWFKDTRTLALSMACPTGEWATAQLSLAAVDVSVGGPGLCGLAPDMPHPLGAVGLHAAPQFAPGEADLAGIVLTVGATRFEGAAQLAYNGQPRLDLSLSTPRIDLDSEGAPSSGPAPARLGRVRSGDGAPFSPIGTAHAAAPPPPPSENGFRLPQGIFATLTLSAGEIAHHHLSFRDVSALLTLDDGELVLNRLDGTPPGGGRISADATLSTPGGMPILDGHVRVDADHPEVVLAWAGLGAGTALPASTAEAEGTAADGVISLRKLAVKSGGAGFDGTADLALEDNDITIDRAHMTLIGTPWNGTAFDAQGALESDENGLTRLDKLKIVSGMTSITGQVGVVSVLGRPTVAADLGGDHWVLDGLDDLAPAPPPAQSKTKAKTAKDRGKPSDVDDSLARPKVQDSPLAPQQNLKPLALADGADIRLTLHPQSASFGGNRFDAPTMVVALSGDTVVIDNFKAGIWGGDVVGSGRLTLRGLPQISATLSAGGVDISQAHLSAGPLKLTKGTANGDTRCSSIGRNSADMIRHLECTGQIRVNAGEIAGIDLGAIDTAAKGISNPVGILGLAKAAHGGRTAFTALTASLRLGNGTLSTDDAKLDADGGTVQLAGRYTPAQQTVDAKAQVRLAGTRLPAVGLRLDGPVAQPRVTLDVNALMRGAVSGQGQSAVKSALSPQMLKGLIKSLSQP